MSYATLVPSPYAGLRGLGAAASTSVKTPKIGFAIPPKPTYCGDISLTGNASGVKMSACGKEINSIEGAGGAVIGVGRKIVQGAAVVGGAAACGAVSGGSLSYFCGAAAALLADKLIGPFADMAAEQFHLAACTFEDGCPCEKKRSAAAVANGKAVYEAFKPLCLDTACVGRLHSFYVSNLPTGTTTYSIAGLGVRKCSYKAFPHTKPVFAAGSLKSTASLAANGWLKNQSLPGATVNAVAVAPKPIMPSPRLFEQSADRSAAYAAQMAKNAAETWLPRCTTNKCREQISQASVVMGAQYAKALLDNGVLLPDSPRYPMQNDQAAASKQFTKANKAFTDLAVEALAEESKAEGQQAFEAYLTGRSLQSKDRGLESFEAWKNVQLADENRRKNMMLAGGLAVAFLAASAWVVIKRKGHNS